MHAIATHRFDRFSGPQLGVLLNAAAAETEAEERLDAYRVLSQRYPVAIVWWSLAVELARRSRALRAIGSAFADELRAEAMAALAETTRLDRRMGMELLRILRDDHGFDCRGAFHA